MGYHYKNAAPKKRPAKKKKQKTGYIRWVLLAAVLILIFVFFTGKRSVLDLIQLKQRKASLEKQETKLIEEKAALKKEIKQLKSDDEYIEKVAREKFNMKKKDETVYHLKKK